MISILIPCYNGEKYIERCVNSCLNQIYKNIKIIIVNDGSTDNSEKIIKTLMQKDSRIEYYKQQNKGLAKTRNVLLNKVNTEFFFFLDADDYLEKDAMEKFIKHSQDVEMVINSCYVDYKNKSKLFYISKKINHKTNSDTYLVNNTPFAWGILIRTEFIKKNNFSFYDEFSFFEDAGVMTYWIYKAKKIAFFNEPKYHYIVNKNSLSRSMISKQKIVSSINQLNNLYRLISNDKDINQNKLPKSLNDQLAFYHSVIFTYIQFQSDLSKKEKKRFKQELKLFEKNNWKLKFPKRYWKFWYFLLYRLFFY